MIKTKILALTNRIARTTNQTYRNFLKQQRSQLILQAKINSRMAAFGAMAK